MKKNISKMFVVMVKYFSVLCAGAFVAVAIEYGLCADTILGFVLSAVLFGCTCYSLHNDFDNEEEGEEYND